MRLHLAFSMMNEYSNCSIAALWSKHLKLFYSKRVLRERQSITHCSCCLYVVRAVSDRPRPRWARDWAVIINIIVMGSIRGGYALCVVHQKMVARGIIYRWGRLSYHHKNNPISISLAKYKYRFSMIRQTAWEIWNAQIGRYIFSAFSQCVLTALTPAYWCLAK